MCFCLFGEGDDNKKSNFKKVSGFYLIEEDKNKKSNFKKVSCFY